MPTRLMLVDAEGISNTMDVPDDTLVLSMSGIYKRPDRVTYVLTHSIPIASVGLIQSAFDDDIGVNLHTYQRYLYKVTDSTTVDTVVYPNTIVPTTNDPTNGNCICGITCTGNKLNFVRVNPVTN